MKWLVCLWRGRHEPRRHVLGCFRCEVCGVVGRDLDEFVYGSGYVSPMRPIFDRATRTITRDGWAA